MSYILFQFINTTIGRTNKELGSFPMLSLLPSDEEEEEAQFSEDESRTQKKNKEDEASAPPIRQRQSRRDRGERHNK